MSTEKKPNYEKFEKLYLMYIQNKFKFFSYGFSVLLLIIFVGMKLPIFKKVSIEKLVSLEQKYSEWKNEPNNKAKYQSLSSAMDKIPSFGVLLEPEIAQRLIYEDNDHYKVIGKKILSRTSPSYFVDFSKITMLISEKKYLDAYNNSLELKSNLEKSSKDNLSIYPYNLLRICFLMKEMKDFDKELQGWNDLEKYITEKETSFAAQIKKNNGLILTDYISHRKQLLNKKSLFHEERLN